MKKEQEIRNAILEADRLRVLAAGELEFVVGGLPPTCTDTCGEVVSSLSTCTKVNTDKGPLSV